MTRPARQPLTPDERAWLATVRDAETLADLADGLGTDSGHAAYRRAKPEWYALRDRELPPEPDDPFPGRTVDMGPYTVTVHGITHADTDAERAVVRAGVERLLGAGATVYCEQGIRSLYLADRSAVCAMDDLRWAMTRCARLDGDSHLEAPGAFSGLHEEVADVASTLREATFSLIHAGRSVYGTEFARALGDVATSFVTGHGGLATAEDYRSFTLSRAAAADPTRLPTLQRYYARRFLPQPLEREWLRRHDPELELLTHARNARMADYAVAHRERARAVHLVVGAAHQPGIAYYLARHAAGERDASGFEPA